MALAYDSWPQMRLATGPAVASFNPGKSPGDPRAPVWLDRTPAHLAQAEALRDSGLRGLPLAVALSAALWIGLIAGASALIF